MKRCVHRTQSLTATLALCLIVTFLFVACCVSPSWAEGTRYLKVNIHCQHGSGGPKASYANWTEPASGHFILPVGSEVEIKRHRSGFEITEVKTKKEVFFEYSEKDMRMTPDEYIDAISSLQPVSLKGYSALDKKGIKGGTVHKGMSKKGVMAALGYPAAHFTASPDENTWTYWRNRWRKFTVEFDGKGIVKGIKR